MAASFSSRIAWGRAPRLPRRLAVARPGTRAAGEPCSFLTKEEVGAIVGTTPVEVAERVGRGDCDYWLTAAKDAKISIGVFSGPDDTTLFEGTKGIGDPQPVLNVGDDAYSISTGDLGTLSWRSWALPPSSSRSSRPMPPTS